MAIAAMAVAAMTVAEKRNLAKSLKKDEKIKLYTKVASVIPLANYDVHYLCAGIAGQDIVIIVHGGGLC